ncbi:MAG: pyruvate kinase [Halobacteriovoraceae bacterium]|jgi:pyruvate kinase|nr:pyruvate kinase [Halobacteriovoraceae bacterium]MBT5094208.1 pyruvate kinase [Halobacteriovoraceae bacterium]
MRRTKIVATLGPASSSEDKIIELIKAGMNVARLNMSHGSHQDHQELITTIRKASRAVGREVAILMDLQGPKIRVDKLPAELVLKAGEEWVIGSSSKQKDYQKKYSGRYIPTVYDKLIDDCRDGVRILFDDGLLSAEAISRDGDVYKIKVITGGTLKSNKGINLPDCVVSAPAFTEKDKKDLLFGLGTEIDYIALSFVQRAEDISQVKHLLHKYKKNIPIIAKIEKPQAVDNILSILKVADVIMVARGDMGVEAGNHNVPSIQKKLINLCNQHQTPVITATQMLESMTENPTPTRAEASDVANAIWDGTDAVMLSGETASGKYPTETITMMDKIICEAEKTPKERPFLRHMDLSSVNASLMVAASMMAEKVDAELILSVTESGHSCRKIAAFRPNKEVLAVTNSIDTVRRVCLFWGVTPYLLNEKAEEDDFDFQKEVIEKIKDEFKLKNGQRVVLTRGDGKFFSKGSANSVKIEVIKNRPSTNHGSDTFIKKEDEKKKILLDTSICGTCQNCISICPHGIYYAINDEYHSTAIDGDKIIHCPMDGECIRVCPTGAIEIIPKNT